MESWFQIASLEQLSAKLKTPFVVDAANTLFENIERVHTGLVMLPLNFVGIAGRLQGCFSTAVFEITGKSVLSDEERTPELEAKLAHRMMELVREEQADDLKSENVPFYEKSASLWGMIMHLYLCDETKGGLLAVRESIVMNVWSAIEVALEQVWDNAVAILPHVEARNGIANRITTLAAAKLGASIPTVQSRAGKERLKSIQAIREAFSRGFAVDCVEIDNALAASELETLALVRNLLAHKRGLIDQEFKDRAPFFPSLAKTFTSDEERLKLPGPMVGKIVSDGLEASMSVLVSIDEWVQAHP